MTDTKERILLTALRLFAERGYEAVSVSDIAQELGITKGALYKHYRNKRDIFENILTRMEERDAEQANAHDLPEGTVAEMEEAYAAASADDTISFSKAMFRYWTEDAFAAQFRKMLILEQFGSPEMGRLYQQYLVSGPIGYMTDLFYSWGEPDPKTMAVRFYAPMFLLFSVYDGAENKTAVLDMIDRILEQSRNDLTGGNENER